AKGGYAAQHENHRLEVVFAEDLLAKIPQEKRTGLLQCLADDPRPSYQDDERRYGMHFADFEIKFQVQNNLLTVLSVEKV
ncbi:MAG: hypothetical protein IIX02_06775, partial [Clostridia bacterium]|nr:hypothetical protein [Clostridia bacterium]